MLIENVMIFKCVCECNGFDNGKNLNLTNKQINHYVFHFGQFINQILTEYDN